MKWILLMLGLMLLIGTASAVAPTIDTVSLNHSYVVGNYPNGTIAQSLNISWTASNVPDYYLVSLAGTEYENTTSTFFIVNQSTISNLQYLNVTRRTVDINITGANADGSGGNTSESFDVEIHPTVYHDFSNNAYVGGTNQWGVLYPNWTVINGAFDTSNSNLSSGGNGYNQITTPCTITNGTFKASFRMPGGDGNSVFVMLMLMEDDGSISNIYPYYNRTYKMTFGQGYGRLELSKDPPPGHRHIAPMWGNTLYQSGLFEYYFDDTASLTGLGSGWLNITVIRDEDDYWYAYMEGRPDDRDGDYISWSYFWSDHELMQNPTRFGFYLYQGSGEKVYVDDIKIYESTYLFPESSSEYVTSANDGNVVDSVFVHGWNNTLQTISDDIANTSRFVYYPGNNTAYCYYNLVVDKGSKLTIDNETLYLDNSALGSNTIFWLKNGAHIIIKNSTIDSVTSDYVRWKFAQDLECEGGGRSGKQYNDFRGKLIIKNSTIKDACFQYGGGDSGTQETTYSDIQDTSFLNMKYNNRFSFADTWMSYTFLRNVSITLDSGGKFYLVWLSESHKWRDISISGGNLYYDGSSKVINFDPSATTENWNIYDTDGRKIHFRYYLDVLTEDSNSNPLSEIHVTVENEIDDVNYYSSNLNKTWAWKRAYDRWGGSGANANNSILLWYIDHTLRSTSTMSDGHTPLPIGNESSTLLITERWQKNATSLQEFTYNISCYDRNYIWSNVSQELYSNGTIIQSQPLQYSSGINPTSGWYRPEPNTHLNTTTLQIASGKSRTNFSITTDTTITITPTNDENFSATWAGSAILTINSTIPSFASSDVLLKHDDVTVDTDTANATGFVSFDYTGSNGNFNITQGAWSFNSSHTYTNVNYRYFTNGTRTIIGRNPVFSDTDMGDNTTMPWPVIG